VTMQSAFCIPANFETNAQRKHGLALSERKEMDKASGLLIGRQRASKRGSRPSNVGDRSLRIRRQLTAIPRDSAFSNTAVSGGRKWRIS